MIISGCLISDSIFLRCPLLISVYLVISFFSHFTHWYCANELIASIVFILTISIIHVFFILLLIFLASNIQIIILYFRFQKNSLISSIAHRVCYSNRKCNDIDAIEEEKYFFLLMMFSHTSSSFIY